MKTIVYTALLLGFIFLAHSTSFAQCNAENWPAENCNNSNSVLLFPHLEAAPVLFQIGNQFHDPLLRLGQYQVQMVPLQFLDNWEQGTTMFFAFDGNELASSGSINELQGKYTNPNNNQIVIYGLNRDDFPTCNTLLSMYTGDDRDSPGSLVVNTIAYPSEFGTGQFTNFNDVIQVPQNQIFQIFWGGPGSNECQDYEYSLTITY